MRPIAILFSLVACITLGALVSPAEPRGIGSPGMGPPGPAGAQGDLGPAGAPGAQGPQGERGPQGVPGTAGARGDKGDAGPQGPKGDTGVQGPTGTNGAPGQTGERGPAGATGPVGPTGAKGDPGPQGVAGAPGLKGDTGATGPTGAQGPAGKGLTFVCNATVSETVLVALSAGIRVRDGVPCPGAVTTDLLIVIPTAGAAALQGYAVHHAFPTAANTLRVILAVPALAVAASYSLPVAVYAVNR